MIAGLIMPDWLDVLLVIIGVIFGLWICKKGKEKE